MGPLLPDKPMQLNQSLFMLGGRSGYVLQPDMMRDDIFDPFDKSSLKHVEPITVQLQVSRLGSRGTPPSAPPLLPPPRLGYRFCRSCLVRLTCPVLSPSRS